MSDSNIENLKWIKIFDPNHIPNYLIEQIKHRDYSIEDFFKYHEVNSLGYVQKHGHINPFSQLYLLATKENLAKGFLWFVIDPLTKDIIIQSYSVDKEYWGKGAAVEKLAKLIKEIKEKGKFKKVYWVTNYPKHSEKFGFKRSKSILMEYKGETYGEDIDGGDHDRREHRPIDSRTEKLPE